jgi:hypothetical protein
VDRGGWFCTRSSEFHHLEDIQLICAARRTAAGCPPISQRLLRHFQVNFCFIPYLLIMRFQVATLTTITFEGCASIFMPILRWYAMAHKLHFNLRPLTDDMVAASGRIIAVHVYLYFLL